jgi:hypothetical protein
MKIHARIFSLIPTFTLSLPLFACSADRAQTAHALSAREQLLSKLETAEVGDRMNSVSWTADNPAVDHLCAEKAAELKAVIVRIKAGQNVTADEISDALDNRQIHRAGSY